MWKSHKQSSKWSENPLLRKCKRESGRAPETDSYMLELNISSVMLRLLSGGFEWKMLAKSETNWEIVKFCELFVRLASNIRGRRNFCQMTFPLDYFLHFLFISILTLFLSSLFGKFCSTVEIFIGFSKKAPNFILINSYSGNSFVEFLDNFSNPSWSLLGYT